FGSQKRLPELRQFRRPNARRRLILPRAPPEDRRKAAPDERQQKRPGPTQYRLSPGTAGTLRLHLGRFGKSCRSQFPLQFEPSLRQFQDEPVVFPFVAIIFPQLLPNPTHVQPDDGVLAWVVVERLSQRIDTDRIFIQLVGLAGERL